MNPTIPGLASVIIPVHNRPSLVQEAVASVLAQTYRPLEIWVVDDGSTDDTPAVLARLARDHPQMIQVIRQTNQGPGLAREAGRRRARGEFLQYLDSDDLLMPCKLELQVQALRQMPDADVCYGKTRHYRFGESAMDVADRRTGERIDRMFPEFLVTRFWNTVTPLYRRRVTDKAGPWAGLRQEEDWEYDCRIALHGGRLCYCDAFLADQRRGTAGGIRHAWTWSSEAFRDRVQARMLIYQHARAAGVTVHDPAMQHFARGLFLLARQAGVAGLADEAKQLFYASRTVFEEAGIQRLDYRLYGITARLLGWRWVGVLASKLPRRPRPQGY